MLLEILEVLLECAAVKCFESRLSAALFSVDALGCAACDGMGSEYGFCCKVYVTSFK